VIRILHFGAHGNETGSRVDLRIDADNLARKVERVRRRTDLDGLPELDGRQRLFRNREVDTHHVGVLQRGDDRAGRQVLAEIDFGDADNAGKRSLDRLLRQRCAHFFNACACGIGGRSRRIDIRHRTPAPGFSGCEVRLLNAVFHLKQQGAFLDFLIGLEVDLLHDAVELHGQVNTIERVGRADGLDTRLPDARFHRDGRNRLGGLLHVGEEVLDGL